MKPLIPTLLLSSMLVLAGCATVAESMGVGPMTDAERATPLRSQFDARHNQTQVILPLGSAETAGMIPRLEVAALLVHPDTVVHVPWDDVFFVFTSAVSNTLWHSIRNSELTLVLDDAEELRLPGDPAGDLSRAYGPGAVLVKIPPPAFRRLTTASRVRARMPNVEFSLDSTDIAGLRALRAYAQKEPGAVRPAPARVCRICQ
jgi:hypothetical protein